MPKIFVSYRRVDSSYAVHALVERLRARLGDDNVFLDVEAIDLGVDYRHVIAESVASCDVLVAVIGEKWVTVVGDDGQRRLDDPADSVRLEIETALKRDIPVIPVLVDAATMPGAGQLPESLADLVFRNATEIRSGPDFAAHMQRLTDKLAPVSDPPADPVVPAAAAAGQRLGVAELAVVLGGSVLLVAGGAAWWLTRAEPCPDEATWDACGFVGEGAWEAADPGTLTEEGAAAACDDEPSCRSALDAWDDAYDRGCEPDHDANADLIDDVRRALERCGACPVLDPVWSACGFDGASWGDEVERGQWSEAGLRTVCEHGGACADALDVWLTPYDDENCNPADARDVVLVQFALELIERGGCDTGGG